MSYIKSDKLKVFPTAHTRTSQLSSRMLYEQNIANIIGQFIDKDGFVVQFPKKLETGTNSIIINNNSSSLIFNLQGYYFTLLPGASFPKPDGEEKYLIAYLNTNTLDTDNLLAELKELKQDSAAGDFEGLSIEIITDLKSISVPYIILYKSIKDSSSSGPAAYTWKDYTDSLAKFELSSLHITGIDGKYQ